METKKQYFAPELTVVTFKTERGYAQSTTGVASVIKMMLGSNVQLPSTQEGWSSEVNLFGNDEQQNTWDIN